VSLPSNEAAGKPLRRGRKEILPATGTNLADHVAVRARLYALEAATRGDVEWFRHEVLGDQLLKPDAVEPWIRRQAEIDGRPTLYLEVVLPEGVSIKMRDRRLVAEPGLPSGSTVVGGHGEALAYAVPEDNWVRRIPTTYIGILDKLRVISESLEQHYHWQSGSGSTFVLTGQVPYVGRVRSTVHGGQGRITLDIDASTVTPKDLARIYAKIVEELRPGLRIRAMSEKHLSLALFFAERPNREWADRLQEWNKTHPDGGIRMSPTSDAIANRLSAVFWPRRFRWSIP
jgi:hypothetical protein